MSDLQFIILNKRKIIAKSFILEALLKVHRDLTMAQIGINKTVGFVLSEETTGSWRSLKLQQQLFEKGVTKTLYSNHRRGTAVDTFPDEEYIKKIIPFMNKYGLVNDLAPWDKGHFNWKSNAIAMSFSLFNELPLLLKEFSMNEYENHVIQLTQQGETDSGAFALVYGGQKHLVSKDRAGLAALTVQFRGMVPAPVNKKVWDSIETGSKF